MPKENLSFMKLLFTPLNIALAFLSSFLVSNRPIRAILFAMMTEIALNAYGIFVIAGLWPEQVTNKTILHVSVYMIVLNLVQTFSFVSTFAFIMQNVDKRVSGIHLTFMACMINLAQYIHKFYVFRVVEWWGIFGSQAVLVAISVVSLLVLRGRFEALENMPKSSWHVRNLSN
jgi:hypothetical protein